MNNTENRADFDSVNLMAYLWKRKKPIIIICAIAAVASIVSSLMIEEKFKSTVVMYPARGSSASKQLLTIDYGGGRQNIVQFGEQDDAEQLLQILMSDEIRNRMVEKYNLFKHYDVDTASPYKNTYMQQEYESNITAKRTKYGSIEVNVLDTDPDTAAYIANDIAQLVDTVRNRMQRERAMLGLAIVEDEYNGLLAEIKEAQDSLTVIRKLGVHDYDSQVERITEQLAAAIVQDKPKAVKALQERLDLLAVHGSAYVAMEERLVDLVDQFTKIAAKYEEIKADVDANLSHKFIVDHAFPADKKTYPVRWLIVVMSTMSAFVFSIFLVIFLDKVKELREGQKFAK